MRIVLATSEAVPFAKSGGLGDVLGALPRQLRRLGHEVAVVLPGYGDIDRQRFGFRPASWGVQVPVSNRTVSAGVSSVEGEDGVSVYLVDADPYFARPGLYGTEGIDYPDNAERFVFFSRAVAAMLSHLGPPDIVHCHDWQSALVPVFLRADAPRYPGLERVRTVLTIHNLAYQGVFWGLDWHLLNLDVRYFDAAHLEFYGKINFLKGGMVFADALTTVSPRYADEIQTAEHGCGLEGVLAARRTVLTGILNGVDYSEWNPEADAALAASYAADDLSGKAACKTNVQGILGLAVDRRLPLIGMVSRLAEQKGFDLLVAALPQLLRKQFQLAVLGTGSPKYETALLELAARYKRRVAVHVGFDDALAHRIEAGSDMFLMPSRYEPCGLNQMYSLRYGTVPLVRATGGLADTVIDHDSNRDAGTGFAFVDYTPAALVDCVGRALRVYRRPRLWQMLMRRGMRADFSWERSARAYEEVYERVCGG